MKKRKRTKIDWPNHLVGFFSALFGILIAFELDEWRERNNQQELAALAMERMLTEIEFNQNMLHASMKENTDRVNASMQLLPHIDEQLRFTGTMEEAISISKQYSHHFYIDTTIHQKTTMGFPVHFDFSGLTMLSQHHAAWESAKATGVLNFMGYEKVLILSSVYNYTSILDELNYIRSLTKQADDITTRSQLTTYLEEVNESLSIIQRELNQYDMFVNMLRPD